MAPLSVQVTVYVALALTLTAGCNSVFISNLDAACMRCICQGATGCNITAGCVKGYCGPFYISHIYWTDADKYVLPEDDPERAGAFHDCAVEYSCAKYMVENYMAKYGRDCNGDGVTDCDDYAMIHYNGGVRCESSLEGTAFHTRFTRCRPPKTSEDDELPQGDQPLPETETVVEKHRVPEFHAAPESHASVESQTPPEFQPAPENHAAIESHTPPAFHPAPESHAGIESHTPPAFHPAQESHAVRESSAAPELGQPQDIS